MAAPVLIQRATSDSRDSDLLGGLEWTAQIARDDPDLQVPSIDPSFLLCALQQGTGVTIATRLKVVPGPNQSTSSRMEYDVLDRKSRYLGKLVVSAGMSDGVSRDFWTVYEGKIRTPGNPYMVLGRVLWMGEGDPRYSYLSDLVMKPVGQLPNPRRNLRLML